MGFAQTYREERLISRRSRARKARILGRIIGFGLTICFVALLRTEPQLRAVVEDIALSSVAAVTGKERAEDRNAQGLQTAQADAIAQLDYAPGSEEARVVESLGIGDAAPSAPGTSALPPSRVKINRGTGS